MRRIPWRRELGGKEKVCYTEEMSLMYIMKDGTLLPCELMSLRHEDY